jgi:hypothetical protein
MHDIKNAAEIAQLMGQPFVTTQNKFLLHKHHSILWLMPVLLLVDAKYAAPAVR